MSRFLAMRAGAFADPASHFHHYSTLTDEQAVFAARDIWHSINRPNLIENILPTRPRATLVLRKDADHSINRLRLRKLTKSGATARSGRSRKAALRPMRRSPMVLQVGDDQRVDAAGECQHHACGGQRPRVGHHDRHGRRRCTSRWRRSRRCRRACHSRQLCQVIHHHAVGDEERCQSSTRWPSWCLTSRRQPAGHRRRAATPADPADTASSAHCEAQQRVCRSWRRRGWRSLRS